ncbi:hypothetical protein [Pseudomonas sp. Irchel 3E13]|uniref:hypothetical protein n=1 Tax=Pseudomonas sp. Irchel 3E13 TaxID=2008975 RepID=UPI0013569730|nr:hypothetical protein [Pseudomonas sp. Irchel 3E13]
MNNAQKPQPVPVKPNVENRVAHHFEALSDERFIDLMSNICGLPVKKDRAKK